MASLAGVVLTESSPVLRSIKLSLADVGLDDQPEYIARRFIDQAIHVQTDIDIESFEIKGGVIHFNPVFGGEIGADEIDRFRSDMMDYLSDPENFMEGCSMESVTERVAVDDIDKEQTATWAKKIQQQLSDQAHVEARVEPLRDFSWEIKLGMLAPEYQKTAKAVLDPIFQMFRKKGWTFEQIGGGQFQIAVA